MTRTTGILLHITSLPGPYGIGDMGPEAYRFIDRLADAGASCWQVLPLNPPGYGWSPYQPWSAFAGSPLLISPEKMKEDGLLSAKELRAIGTMPSRDRVDHAAAERLKEGMLRTTFARFEPDAAYESFRRSHAFWLDDAMLYRALRVENAERPWTEWGRELASRAEQALDAARARLADEIAYHTFVQYQFHRQHEALRARAAAAGVRLFGDIPIFVAHDSADVWAHRDLFALDAAGSPTVVAGVPPDYFSPTGQRWGNPLYRWDRMQHDGYRWWIERLRAALGLYDIVRIDHFRGFAAYWEIPAGNPTAEGGRWVAGPGDAFFRHVYDALGAPAIVAEDLGDITPDVEELRDRVGLPGMKVLQFGMTDPRSTHAPHNFATRRAVVYTGTHDNDTSIGWWSKLTTKEKGVVRDYVGRKGLGRPKGEVADEMIRLALASVAGLAVIPMQDLLRLGSDGRMNMPGKSTGTNWSWRMRHDAFTREIVTRLGRWNEVYGRLPT